MDTVPDSQYPSDHIAVRESITPSPSSKTPSSKHGCLSANTTSHGVGSERGVSAHGGAAALADVLATYYPVAGRLATEHHCDGNGNVVGCSVSVDCAGQGVEILHAVADGVAFADVAPPDAAVRSLFPLDGAVSHDGHELPLLVLQITDLAGGGVFVSYAYNHALSDGSAFWDFFTALAEVSRAAALSLPPPVARRAPPVFERWSPDGGAAAALVLPYADLAGLIKRPSPPPPLRERVLRFSAESLVELKERARQELLAAGDEAGAAAVTKFQALSSLLWRCIARARRHGGDPDQETVCRFAIDNRGRLRPPLPAEYFGNAVYAIPAEAAGAAELLARGHGWAAAAVGRAVAAHTDTAIRARVAAWAAEPTLAMLRLADAGGVVLSNSPRFDMYGCDFGWGKPVAARSGGANKYDGKVTLFPGRDGGGGIDAEVALTPEHMAALEQDEELWAAQKPAA